VVGPPRNLTWNGAIGNWESANNWLDTALPATWDNARPDNATFSNPALPATVTLGTPITAGSITFAALAPVHTLTGGSLTVTGNVTADQSVVLDTPTTIGASQTWTVANGKSITVSQPLTGQSSTALTKAGPGELIFNTSSPNSAASLTINGGTVTINTVNGSNFGGSGNGPVSINSGAAFVINNVALGSGLNANGPQIFIGDGGKLIASGTARYGRSGGAMQIRNGTAGSPTNATIHTATANTVFNFESSHRQATSGQADTFATVHVTGLGRVVFESGGANAATGYRGDWSIDGGIVQLGPVVAGGFGEPLNAWGLNGFADHNPVTINSGAIVAGATNTANSQTSGSDFFASVGGAQNFPGSFRSPITLAGGAIATTVDSTSTGAGSLNEAGGTDGARYSGNLTIKSGPASTILVNDAVNPTPTARVVVLTTTPGSLGNITWEANSTLNVTGTGTVQMLRNIDNTGTVSGATVSVGAGAALLINPGATVNLGGTLDALSDGTNHVNVTNNSTASFNVVAGSKNVGILGGSGNTTVADAATLTATHVRQNSLTINGTGAVNIRAGASANLPAGTSTLKSLSIAGGPAAPTGKLNLSNNSMVIDYTGPVGTLVGDTRQLLKAGADSGGSVGLVSSAAIANSTGLGYADNAVLGAPFATFAGQPVDDSSLLVKYTYLGDADLDGDVDVADLGALATNWQTSGVWTGGDFDYNGTIDVADLGALATNWQQGVSTPPLGASADLGQALASLGLPSAAVPEPASIGLLCIGIGAAMRRRRN
jgi:hypothetical protein